jgi:small conductance mechanosensitive channel
MSDNTPTKAGLDAAALGEQLFEKLVELSKVYGMQVIAALLIIVVGYVVSKFLSKRVEKLLLRTKSPDSSVAAIARKAVFVTLMVAVFVAVLERFGVETTSFIAVLGAAGLAIGLALQGTLSNIAAGVMLLVLRPFRAGDAVKIGGGEVYIVDEIGLFVTRAHQPDCPLVTIPNSKIWGDTIVNFTDTVEGKRRFDIVFGVSYGDDLNQAIDVLRKLAEDDSRVLAEPAPFIKIDNLGDSSVNILFRVHTASTEWWDAKLDLTKAGKEALEAAGLSIPFPQRDVHLYNSTTQ